MLFDEHYAQRRSGTDRESAVLRHAGARDSRVSSPPSKLILMIGAYGYDWNDAEAVVNAHRAETFDFQEVMRAARGAGQPRAATAIRCR